MNTNEENTVSFADESNHLIYSGSINTFCKKQRYYEGKNKGALAFESDPLLPLSIQLLYRTYTFALSLSRRRNHNRKNKQRRKKQALAKTASRRLCPNAKDEDALETILEVPIPEEMFTSMGSDVALRWQNMMTWMKAQTPDKLESPAVKARLDELRFLLYLAGSPVFPLHFRDCSIGGLTAKFIVQHYMEAVGGEAVVKGVGSMYAIGQVKISASQFQRTSENMEVIKKEKEIGGFLLWQKDPDLWNLEILLSGCKVCCGCNGSISWRHSSNQQTPISTGPPRPLRRFLQGLDPRAIANLFIGAECIGEKTINDQNCFILKKETGPGIREAQRGPYYDTIHHNMWGYFSQKSGLLIQLDDSRLLRMKTKNHSVVFWEISFESVMDDYKFVEGVNVAHGGKTLITVLRYGEKSTNHRREIEESWKIDEVDFNIWGLTMENFRPPSDVVGNAKK